MTSAPPTKTNIVWHEPAVTREQREAQGGHQGCVVWFTGLSGCGKSTVANLVDRMLFEAGCRSFVLDGDNVRHGLNAPPERLQSYGDEFARRFGLTFAADDRRENIRRIGAVADLFATAGIITLAAFVSPYRADRAAVRTQINAKRAGAFIEVFVDAPLEVCESRDPKGLYKKARAGELKNFTGIDDPFEPPEQPEIRLDAATQSAQVLAGQVVEYLRATANIGRQFV